MHLHAIGNYRGARVLLLQNNDNLQFALDIYPGKISIHILATNYLKQTFIWFPNSFKNSNSNKSRENLCRCVRDDEAAEEEQDMSITDDDIIRITASEGIPIQTAKAFDFSRQASSFLLS
ncbi:hypothetical protein DUI87_28665 [Hirundo rustica rustica]|uniref:Uncharacterized protein n=1 Tax=Hirundo rustica rustica TaxID=333673 RepID=A0A3M0J078_HIRRU|nr:hypothetical protein DUI87_28665 [Hirundo rustica rustica]